MLLSCMPQPEMWVCHCGWRLNTGTWDLESRPCDGLLSGAKRQTEGMGVRSSTARGVCGRSSGYHRTTVTLLSYTPGAGPLWRLPHILVPGSMGIRSSTHLNRLAYLTHHSVPDSWEPQGTQSPSPSPPLHLFAWVRKCAPGQPWSRYWWEDDTKRWGWSHSWAPGVVQLREKSWNLSLRLWTMDLHPSC